MGGVCPGLQNGVKVQMSMAPANPDGSGVGALTGGADTSWTGIPQASPTLETQ